MENHPIAGDLSGKGALNQRVEASSPSTPTNKINRVPFHVHLDYERTIGQLRLCNTTAGADEAASPHRNTFRDYVETGALAVALGAAGLALPSTSVLPSHGLSVSDAMGYEPVFVFGLVASVSSCLASCTWRESDQEATRDARDWQSVGPTRNPA